MSDGDVQLEIIADWNYRLTWYHGSPHRIQVLVTGSTLTQDIDLARVFSHKPAVVAMEDDNQAPPGTPRIRHNGLEKGLLYRIDEPISHQDVYPHPRSSMAPGCEWLTRRPLRLRLIGAVAIDPAEFLSEDDIRDFRRRFSQ